jgi:hypothetical protein
MVPWSLRVGAPLLALLGGAARAADNAVPLDEHTARTVGDGQLKLGALAFEYGLTRSVSIGADTLALLAGAFSPVLAPNVHLKVALVRTERFVLAGQAGGYYAWASGENQASGHLWIVPVSLIASVAVLPRLWLHGEINYNWARAVGAGDLDRFQVDGAVSTRAGQLGLMVEARLSRVVALIARGRYQAWSAPLVLRGTGDPDPYTHVEVGAEARTDRRHPWMAVAGLALTWSHVGLVAGGGYGELFIPGANVVRPGRGFVPEGSLWVSF